MLEGCRKFESLYAISGMQNGATTLKTCVECPQTVVKGAPIDPALARLGVQPKEFKSLCWRYTCSPIFAALCTVPRVWKIAQGSLTDEFQGQIGISIQYPTYLAFRGGGIPVIVDPWMSSGTLMWVKEANHQETTTVWLHLHEECKIESWKQRAEGWLPRV